MLWFFWLEKLEGIKLFLDTAKQVFLLDYF